MEATRGSEFVADPETGTVHCDRRILNGKEFDVFPFAANEQAIPQHIFQTEASGPADHEIVSPLLGSTLRYRGHGKGYPDYGRRNAKDVCAGDIVPSRDRAGHIAIDIHASHRDAAEHVRQEVVSCPTGA